MDCCLSVFAVAPRAGAWIEIDGGSTDWHCAGSPLVQGRGLKYLSINNGAEVMGRPSCRGVD